MTSMNWWNRPHKKKTVTTVIWVLNRSAKKNHMKDDRLILYYKDSIKITWMFDEKTNYIKLKVKTWRSATCTKVLITGKMLIRQHCNKNNALTQQQKAYFISYKIPMWMQTFIENFIALLINIYTNIKLNIF